MANDFNIADFHERLKAKEIGKEFVYYEVTSSTMDDAREMAINQTQKYPHGTIVMAERQTKARGARDHKWDASNKGNIYISIILHLPQKFKTFEGRFELEVRACLAVVKVARKFGACQAIPKWPNDVWVRGHKLSGNLVEDSHYNISGSPLCLLILGMGINVNSDVRRSAELHSIATSLICERHGQPSNREHFLADLCLALEENLAESRNSILQTFREENLFQKGCDISVTCPSEGKVINGEFLQVCDNWEVSLKDKRNQEIIKGRSDYLTIRPKVVRKILVVFTGVNGSKSSSMVSRWLTSLVDTSKLVVCLVPESMLTDNDKWMKTCDLLVLLEDIRDSAYLTSKLKAYLNRGGKILASGVAALFLSRFLDIPFKECVLESAVSRTDVSLVYLENSKPEPLIEACDLFSQSPSRSEPVAFLASPICLKFSQVYLMQRSSSSDLTAAFESFSIGKLRASNGSMPSEPTKEKGDNFVLHYSQDEDPDFKVAMFFRPTTGSGRIALVGFDIGIVIRSSGSRPRLTCGDNRDGRKSPLGSEWKTEKEMQRLDKDRFRRDEIMLQILNSFNP